ncbi:MAG: L-2-hydroxyglutarate oxidase, partial [Ignavibacteriaceae bacterium]
KNSDHKILIIEAEDKLAAHQTGNNSGVIHSGLYYKPGSLKAKNCAEGRELMYQFCEENNISYEKCGKIVVSSDESELEPLNMLYERGIANGLEGLKKLNADELKEYEPNVSGIAGLFVPQTGIVDYKKVTQVYAAKVKDKNGEIKLNCRFLSVKKSGKELIISTNLAELKTKFLVNCGGLYSDRIAKICGVEPGLMIIPFRGEYYKLKNDKEHLVKNLIYPVPDPGFPFLGVHFTKMIEGGVEAGPNAVLAFKREGYSHKDISLRDVSEMITYTGFWKMVSKYYKMGLGEFHRSLSKSAFVKALKKLVPEIDTDSIEKGGAGVRAQALEASGKLVDDFRIVEANRMIHVLNAPSPAATASISIGNYIAELAKSRYN